MTEQKNQFTNIAMQVIGDEIASMQRLKSSIGEAF